MFGIIDLATYIVGTLLIVFLPGPNSIYVMSIASRYGIKTGYRGAFGIFTGDAILILCTVLGAASLMHAFPWIFTTLKIVGALYLSYLGFKLLQASYQRWKNKSVEEIQMADLPQLDQIHPYRTALGISLLNPKAILFFLSFFVAICRSYLSLSRAKFSDFIHHFTMRKPKLFNHFDFFRSEIISFF